MNPSNTRPIPNPTPLPKFLAMSRYTMMAMMRLTNGMKKSTNHQPGRPATLHRM
jgi:hypothetical protein